MTAAKWTPDQRCPECGATLTSCDYCGGCGVELLCAQTEDGLAAANRVDDERGSYLVLAHATARRP